jgi:O2-independent ubiquinone biosynthesis accessory factor UbiT
MVSAASPNAQEGTSPMTPAFDADFSPAPPLHPAVRRFENGLGRLALEAALRCGPRLSGPPLRRLLDNLSARHPRAFDALRDLRPATVAIIPADHRAVLLLRVGPSFSVAVTDQATAAGADARISGPLEALVDLLEGRIDGDALFFNRILRISGDTALVVALRNAFDGEDLDLVAEAASAFAPLDRGLPHLRRLGARLFDLAGKA